MRLQTYVNFPGTCVEAFRYYEKHLGGKISSMAKHSENQAGGPLATGEWKDKVLHARIELGETQLMGADVPGAEAMRSAYLSLLCASDAEAERVWKALAEGGQVFMKMEKTFFASRFGMCRDRFGINWMIMHEAPQH